MSDEESVLDEPSELLVQTVPRVPVRSPTRTLSFGLTLKPFRTLIRKRVWLLAALANVTFIYFIINQFRVNQAYDDRLRIVTGNSTASSPILSTFIVNTSTCKIPDLNLWHDSLKLLQFKCDKEEETDPECRKKYPRIWMHSNTTTLIVNETAILESGYSWESLHCCYKSITRVEQSLDHYDENADNRVKYSSCHKITDFETTILHEFIRVFCISTSIVLSNDIVYRGLFAFPQLDSHALQKVNRIGKDNNKSSDIKTPPNVVLLMLDSNSRLNFHRRIPLTLEVLQNAGAQEFFGHTKTSENTYPNTVNFLTGMSEDDMISLCRQTQGKAHDECPFIWKDFDNAGYLTAQLEDLALGGTFTYLKTGFVQKPTDYYLRPMTWAWMKIPRTRPWFVPCIGHQQNDEFILEYMLKILEFSSDKAPVFIHSQFALFSHACINGARFQDKTVSHFIKTLLENFPNTILFLFGDHGDRYGIFRESLLGWYEDKLPAMWIHLPPHIHSSFPEWSEALKINSRRLTSHYDIYHTLVSILKGFNLTTPIADSNSPNVMPGGQSLFTPVPENRTCATANISGSFCACTKPLVLEPKELNSTMIDLLEKAADAITTFISSVLPNECAKLKLKSLVSAKLMDFGGTKDYFVSFYTEPGDFLFEARTTLNSEGKFSVGGIQEILRMNRITKKVNCVKDSIQERFCYCS